MRFGQVLLKFFHPMDEQDRMRYRYEASRALAELEDLQRSLNGHMNANWNSEITLPPISRK